MKLRQVALAGLGFVGLGFAAAVPDGKTDVGHLDDGEHTYHCEQLDIYQCSILGSCSLYENCKTWCIDLMAPGGAKCADAMPNAIEARGAAEIVWDNDATGKYICKDLTIQCCGWDGSSCSFVEYCANGCYDTGHGALCVDRADPPKARDEKAIASASDPQYLNSRRFRYICNNKDVQICHNIEGLPCRNVIHCDSGCISYKNGVSCDKPSALNARNEVEDASVITAFGKCDGVKGKCKMCTATHRGVLTCQFGFCAVKPGDWCLPNKSCYDDCNCCTFRPGKPIVEARSIVARDDSNDASVSAAQGKCDGVPGKCKQCTGTGRGVLTCEFGFCAVKPGDWCDANKSCHDDCNCCRKGKRDDKEIRSLESTPQEQGSPNDVALPTGGCNPGDYWCHPQNYAWLLVCDANGVWQISAYCGMYGIYGCCRGTPEPCPDHRCDCRPSPRELVIDKETKRSIDEVPSTDNAASTIQAVTAAGSCTPGKYWCDQTNFDWIIVCDQSGKWEKSSHCGMTSQGYGCCRGSSIPGGTPFCDCRNLPGGPPVLTGDGPKPRSIDPLENVPKPLKDNMAEEKGCNPGDYRCRQPFVLGHLQVCDSQGVWQISSECCGPYTCYDPPGPTPPHCMCSPSLHLATRQNEGPGPEEPEPCITGRFCCGDTNSSVYVCNSKEKWQLSAECGRENACRRGDNGEAYCDPRTNDNKEGAHLPHVEITTRQLDPLAGPQDPDEPELCTPGRYTCGDHNLKVYTCNFKGNWQLSDSCGSGDICMRGQHHEAYCVASRGDNSVEKESSTLATVARDASSTSKA